MDEKIRAHVYIEGKVQGVFYRDWILRQARGLGLTGWVKNLEDGRVEVVFEGPKMQVEVLTQKCKEGSSASEVKHTDISYEKATGEFDGFSIV